MTTLEDTAPRVAGPWLDADLDAWTRRVLRRHFDPVSGSPYWLRWRPHLGFDPLDITEYRQLERFGRYPLEALRGLDPAELRIGLPVRVDFEQATDEVTLPVFVPAG